MTGQLPTHRHDWFPLALLGFLVLGVLVLADSTDFWRPRFEFLTMEEFHRQQALPEPSSLGFVNPWYMPTVLAIVFLATVVFCAVRARDAGTPIPMITLGLIIGGGAIVGVYCYVIAGLEVSTSDLVTVWLGPLAVLGAAAAAWSYLGLGPGAQQAKIVGSVCLAAAAFGMVVALAPAIVEGLLVLTGLTVLGYLERTVLPVLAGLVFLATTWFLRPGPTGVVIPAAALLLAAFAALLMAQRRQPDAVR
ncbi:hypothetical protein EV193_108192 [Herbihabitans rhizosphaerae]|uniref:Uncharacterized protein n=1 Tax=Herbihabitans rhizosphaerae TaxID=1872711 RepID=A0A4Q7KHS3_9PSEU|nr:hypothetical protein [Herbihabitans rhizosphaerae]RZS34842.1 hypothetical protein EV193_108192 [Herbihabitans rhizosphaerae]